ncbi:MAG: electron transfer flavoprotein subunit beta/FixA family protein, partial [Anaerovorax sp.]
DDGFILSDREFAGADVLATSYAISQGIRTVKDYDLIICGKQTTDGDTAQVGPQIAEMLKIPQVSYAEEVHMEGDKVVVKRQYEDRYHVLEVKPPCLLTALAELAEPRYMHAGGVVDAYNKDIKQFGFDDLKNDLNPAHIGLKGSPTNVFKSFTKQAKGAGTIHKDMAPDEAVEEIIAKLEERHII